VRPGDPALSTTVGPFGPGSLKAGAQASEQDMIDHVRGRLAHFKAPNPGPTPMSIAGIMGRLDPDVRAMAEALLDEFPPPPYYPLGAAAMRELFSTVRPTNPPLEVDHVTEAVIPSTSGGVPVRCYRAATDELLPVVVYVHGGGWVLGSLDGFDHLCRALSVYANALVVSVAYRLAPEHPYPAATDDCEAVFSWLATNAHQLGGDADAIALAGDSAGGNLALSVCHRRAEQRQPAPRCCVLAYPATHADFAGSSWTTYAHAPVLCSADAQWFWGQYLAGPGDREEPAAVPALSPAVGKLPPTLIITAEVDPLRSDCEAFAEIATAAGASITVRHYDGVVHGFFSEYGSFATTEVAVRDAAAFLAGHLHLT
jgi:acetyl esterase